MSWVNSDMFQILYKESKGNVLYWKEDTKELYTKTDLTEADIDREYVNYVKRLTVLTAVHLPSG